MPNKIYFFVTRLLCGALIAGSITGCNALDRISQIGEEPPITKIQNPTTRPDYKPISMPMPAPIVARYNPSSLWRTGSRAFLKDLRASKIGDIVTVIINVDDKANLENATNRTCLNTETASTGALFGYEAALNSILPEAVVPTDLLDIDSSSNNNGTEKIGRDEKITIKIAAVITQVLPNGNLVLQGQQEIRVNFEVRDIQIAGIIRPQDIDNQNAVSHEKIAELRVSYGGRGKLTDFQQPRYGEQLIDIIFPF